MKISFKICYTGFVDCRPIQHRRPVSIKYQIICDEKICISEIVLLGFVRTRFNIFCMDTREIEVSLNSKMMWKSIDINFTSNYINHRTLRTKWMINLNGIIIMLKFIQSIEKWDVDNNKNKEDIVKLIDY